MIHVAVTFARKELLEELNNCNLPVFIYMPVPFKILQARELRRGEGKYKSGNEMHCEVSGCSIKQERRMAKHTRNGLEGLRVLF
jgi:hypothetical protein